MIEKIKINKLIILFLEFIYELINKININNF